MQVEELLSKSVVLVAGKGGVGRTSVAAALAIWGARRGKKRILLAEIADTDTSDRPLATTESPSPLAQSFGIRHFTPQPLRIDPQLPIEGVLLHARTGQELFLTSVVKLRSLVEWTLQSEAIR
jgi:hypothetical protein